METRKQKFHLRERYMYVKEVHIGLYLLLNARNPSCSCCHLKASAFRYPRISLLSWSCEILLHLMFMGRYQEFEYAVLQ